MEKVVVLMSIYNGEKYLVEQIDSILQQKDIDIFIIVRDDGSTDGSRTIVKKYEKVFPDKVRLLDGHNIGWKKSFFALLSYAKANLQGYEYFSFADQDDIWLPNKLMRGVEKLSGIEDDVKLYCSNLLHYEGGEVKGEITRNNIIPNNKNCFSINRATGCTIIFNRLLLEILRPDEMEIIVPHDHWLYIVAMLCGRVIIDNQAEIKYRIHGSNQIGNDTGFSATWKKRIKEFNENIRYREKLAKEVLRLHGASMKDRVKSSVIEMADYRKNLSLRLRLLKDNGYSMHSLSGDVIFKLKLLFGIV